MIAGIKAILVKAVDATNPKHIPKPKPEGSEHTIHKS